MTKKISTVRRVISAAACSALTVVPLAGCAGAGGGSTAETTVNVATVSNPQMKDLESLKGEFEAQNPGIRINFTQMEENDLRDAVTKDVATQSGQYDVLTVGAFEVPLWQKNGWLSDLTAYASGDASYDVDDLIAPVRAGVTVEDRLFAVPFYGESSFLMYNKELFAKAGLTMPENPTWTQVAELARKLKSPQNAGICLRGKPGWGESAAVMTTVVNTFGGAWFDASWNSKVNEPAFSDAIEFYTGLVRDAGEADPVSTGYTECLNLFSQGKAAMWYDATAAAGVVENKKSSSVAGKVGYVPAPVEKTASSGWLWSWNLAIPATSKKQDAAWKFVSWATSKEYVGLVGNKLGWSQVPPGTRKSTYDNPNYQEAASTFAKTTRQVLESVDPKQPGVTPQPWTGIQYVTIPEWQNLGNQASQTIAEVYSGRSSVEAALKEVHELAQNAGKAQK